MNYSLFVRFSALSVTAVIGISFLSACSPVDKLTVAKHEDNGSPEYVSVPFEEYPRTSSVLETTDTSVSSVTSPPCEYSTVSDYCGEISTVTALPETIDSQISEVPPEETKLAVMTQTTPLATDAVSHPSPNICGYTPKYYQLSDNEQLAYDIIVTGISSFMEEIPVENAGLSSSQIYRVYEAVLSTTDMALYCPIRSYTYICSEDESIVYTIKPKYTCDSAQAAAMKSELDTKADEIISSITDDMTDMDIVKLFHDYIILNCDYRQQSENYDNAYGALIEGKATCEGYSRAMAFLCGKAGIVCELVKGNVPEEHMWNMVVIDNAWYHIDLTWDDPILSVYDKDYVGYYYFNLSDDQLYTERSADTSLFDVPLAYSSAANYFVYYNLIAGSVNEASDIIKAQIMQATENGHSKIIIKYTDINVYNDIQTNLFGDGWVGFFQIIDDLNSKLSSPIDKGSISIKRDEQNLTNTISL